MRRSLYPWRLDALFNGRPTVGGLMDLCEENYRHIMRLAPCLRELSGCYRSQPAGAMELYLQILEQTPYTSLIHITYYFSQAGGHRPDPDARIRIYHDSRQAEVIHIRQRALPLNSGPLRPTMAQKWKINMFLSKWLAYCRQQQHGFTPDQRIEQMLINDDLVESC